MASMAKLEQRMSALEKSVSQEGDPVSVPTISKILAAKRKTGKRSQFDDEDESKDPRTYISELQTLMNRFDTVEKSKLDNFKQFQKEYENSRAFLSTDVEMKELLASNEMKESILLAGAEGFQKSATLYEEVDQLKAHVNKSPISNFPVFEVKLAKAELAMGVNQNQAKLFHEETNKVLEEYNSVINCMSQNFLLWNSMLTQWETQVEAAMKKKNIK